MENEPGFKLVSVKTKQTLIRYFTHDIVTMLSAAGAYGGTGAAHKQAVRKQR
jgi:hypothetical protein